MDAVAGGWDDFQFTAVGQELRVGFAVGAWYEVIFFTPDDQRRRLDSVEPVILRDIPHIADLALKKLPADNSQRSGICRFREARGLRHQSRERVPARGESKPRINRCVLFEAIPDLKIDSVDRQQSQLYTNVL